MQALRSFSTTATRHAAKATKGGKAKAAPKRAQRQIVRKKPKAGDSSESSAASAFASKVTASKASAKLNPEAPQLQLTTVTPTAYTSDNVGTVFETPASVVTQLYALNVMEKLGGYEYFSQLASVLRQPAVDLAEILSRDGPSKDRRVLLDGPAGSGKSVAMLQAITLALQKKWVVISIPRGEALVDSSFPYTYDEKSKSWRQAEYMAEMLGRIAEGNKDILRLQNTSKTFSLDRHSVPEKASLHKLLEVGSTDPAVSFAVFDAFISEMNIEGRPPVLFTLEGFTILTLPSKYRTPEFESIHPFDIEIVKTFIDYLNGSKSFNNGMIIAATSSRPACMPRALQLALGHAKELPYEKVDARIAPSVAGVKVMHVGEYSHAEAKSVIQHYASAGLLRGVTSANVDDTMVAQRTMLGGALGREVFRSCLKQL